MKEYIKSLSELRIEEIPWQCLSTPYGTGEMIPEMIKNKEIKKIGNLIEHQSTLWQVTPWTIWFLLKLPSATYTTEEQEQLNDLIDTILFCCEEYDVANLTKDSIHNNPLHLLHSEYLWDDQIDSDLEWEKTEPRGYDQKTFASYYWYSRKFILDYQNK
ncbi:MULTISPECIES: hypothetical protein [unclassified Enterococcus]|uniref:hypothetical protein n=1 Tax=unclassified Enterococcus TaxID=2608891 RepID=UPI001CE0900C|nr:MULTISPECIES: hypothetical protein [unclassified Enterococcus]MCA5014517.1 hypothetical protein [Enterococcus sp. S23]MCA5017770.1 hypothetical protein [Enterococcus sp. S22(2020)]